MQFSQQMLVLAQGPLSGAGLSATLSPWPTGASVMKMKTEGEPERLTQEARSAPAGVCSQNQGFGLGSLFSLNFLFFFSSSFLGNSMMTGSPETGLSALHSPFLRQSHATVLQPSATVQPGSSASSQSISSSVAGSFSCPAWPRSPDESLPPQSCSRL